MTDLVVFGDARAAVIDYLQARLATRTEGYAAGAQVAGKLPSPAGASPWVYVVNEGVPDAVGHEVRQVATVRVSVWHDTPEHTHDLAQLCRALLAGASTSGMAACRPLTGPFDTVDPDVADQPLSYFTVAVTLLGSRVPA